MASHPEPPDPGTPVGTREELEALLVAGLDSGPPREMSEDDWEALRRRAMAGAEIRKSG